MHLNTEDLVDIAEGTRSERTAPHLAACEPCRARLQDLRAMMAAAREVDVPEPSPLFWDHLSSRVGAAVAEESARPTPSRSIGGALAAWFGARAFQASIAVVAGLLIALALGSRALAPAPVATPPPIVLADAVAPPELLADVASDPSLTLVASLTDEVDLATAREAGLAPRGSAEHAVTHMSEGELRELGRLLKEELARSGA